ncbi:MAG: ABC transporter permease [Candidatus Bathyarchaeota archaeon]|nr:ABC transporter permease [Candidatus Bathyarchaeota archaeon]
MTTPHLRKSSVPFTMPRLSYRVWKVWRRNLDVFLKTITVNFLPSLLEPILYLVAFGFGLGGFIPNINGVPYINFIAPALVAIAIMNGSFFECTYASFVRMYFQKTFDAIVATPVSVEEVVAGELLWGATRSTINGTLVLIVIAAASLFTPIPLISTPLVFLVPVIAFFGGLLFSAIAMCFTAAAPNIDFFNYSSFLFVMPMFFLCGTFFPLTSLPQAVQVLALWVLPLTQLVNVTRIAVVGAVEPILGLSTSVIVAFSVVWLAVVTILFFILSINLMKRRLTA